MARPTKDGIDYFSFDVDFFSDPKVRILKARFGADGLILFITLLTDIYREGYYLTWDEDTEYIVASELNMSIEKVRQVLKFLLERSLLNSTLFQSDTILTSAGIQKRYQEAVKSRATKNPITIEKYWVLNREETKSWLKVTHFDDCSEKSNSYSENNGSYSAELVHKVKKSKVKESKGNHYVEGEGVSGQDSVIDYFEKSLGRKAYKTEKEIINQWLNDELEENLVKAVIDEAILQGVPKIKYMQGIMKNLATESIKTLHQFKSRSKKPGRGSFGGFTQREYSEDEINALYETFSEEELGKDEA